MLLLQVHQLSKYFGADLVLSNIRMEIREGDKTALVGRNGAGKSTLLKIIAGELSHDSGQILKPKDVTVGYLEQHTGLESNLTIWEEMLSVFSGIQKMEKALREIEQKLSDPANYKREGAYQRLLNEYDRLQETFKEMGGYQYEADIRSVLHGFQFFDKDYHTPVSNLSGGQKTRLALAKLLLSRPDLLILDEPTNHLDIETMAWLEKYLQNYPGALLLVSHDRYFLDQIVTQVYELSRGNISVFLGNYSKYLEQKAEKYEREIKEYEKQQEEIARMEDFIQRNLARASTTKRAQSRRRQLEKMKIMDRPEGGEKSASFSFTVERPSGKDVLAIKGASIGYDGKPLARNIDLAISRGDSIALVGPNGIGKSTLLKSIIQKIPFLSGEVRYGANVQFGYYDQEQANVRSNRTVLEELWHRYPLMNEKDVRSVLGNFLFTQDDVLKTVSSLSGGEKARLALAILMLEKANVLVLDEPTNHLDLDSKEVLENALVDYPGTILFVSHDRYFINRIATKVVELSTEGAQEFLGDYDYYVHKKAEMAELQRLNRRKAKPKAADHKQSYELEKELKKQERQKKRRIGEIEERVALLEAELGGKEGLLTDPAVYGDHERALGIHQEMKQIQAEIDQLLEEWTELAESLTEK
jgi:ATP-binding cassette subfamily F protein 3